MIQAAVETLLRQKIGLETISIGAGTVSRAIQRCLTASGITDPQVYLARLQTSSHELEDLIEAVVVPETWFFRDQEPFVCLSNFVLTEWLLTRANQTLRILSLPCATGEEPYSIAMSLIEAGLPTQSFSIDAVDISKKALQKARQAIYGRNSFRGNDLSFRDRYFTPVPEGYKVVDPVKDTVNFMHGNLQDPQLLISQLPYDIIFCRNVLIYFDDTAKAQALQTLDRLLKPQGLLFVGHAEAPQLLGTQLLGTQFISMRHSRAFAYRKETKNRKIDQTQKQCLYGCRSTEFSQLPNSILNSRSPLVSPAITSKTDACLAQEKLYPPLTFQSHLEVGASPQSSDESAEPTLEIVCQMAQQGRSQEAITACETYLKQNRTSAAAYFLLGQLYQAKGQVEQAEQSFQKAIYLDPNQIEALNQLFRLKEKRGDLAAAKVLHQRIQRVEQRGLPAAIGAYNLKIEFPAKSISTSEIL